MDCSNNNNNMPDEQITPTGTSTNANPSDKNEDLTNIECLPPEILQYIFTYLNPSQLFCCSAVCKRWNSLSKQEILDRVEEARKSVFFESIKYLNSQVASNPVPTKTSNGAAEQDVIMDPQLMATSSKILEKLRDIKSFLLFEKLRIKPSENVHLDFQPFPVNSTNLKKEDNILRTIMRWIGYQRIAYFVRCQKFFITYLGDRAIFSVICEDNCSGGTEQAQAGTSSTKPGIVEDYFVRFNKSHTNEIEMFRKTNYLSVFGNNIFVTGSKYKSIVWLSVEVNHGMKNILLERIRTIYTPFFIDKFLFYNDKLFIIYEPNPKRYVGMWNVEDDELMLSEDSLVNSNWLMRQINNLLFLIPSKRGEANDYGAGYMDLDSQWNYQSNGGFVNQARREENQQQQKREQQMEQEDAGNEEDDDDECEDEDSSSSSSDDGDEESSDDEEPEPVYLDSQLLDTNNDSLVMYPVNIQRLLIELLTHSCVNVHSKALLRAHPEIINIASFGNLAMFICGEDKDKEPRAYLIILGVMKRDPKIEDFFCTESFLDLFYLESTTYRKFYGPLSIPFIYQDSIYMLGLFEDSKQHYAKVIKTTS